ncbi:MAG: hypothetical protein MJ189_04905 [Coriobacteriales bacterium]|nr:hypothetical protein [Coriobacteriales bacterium]
MDFIIEKNKTYICDISISACIRVSGNNASQFLSTMCTANINKKQSSLNDDCCTCVQGLFLNTQSEIIELATILISSANEYLIFCHPENSEELEFWLSEHGKIKDDQGLIFEDLFIENISDQIAALLIFGQSSNKYLKALDDACVKEKFYLYGSMKNCQYAIYEPCAYLLVTPTKFASQIGDFFASYNDIEAIDCLEYKELVTKKGIYKKELYESAYINADSSFYKSFIRDNHNFVGSNGLD